VFFLSGKRFFLLLEKEKKLHIWASKVLQNFATLKRKKKQELVRRGLEPLAVEVVKSKCQ